MPWHTVPILHCTLTFISRLQVDFSRNSIRRLNKDVLEGLEPHLLHLRLDHNLLGNNYNPIFSSSEIAKLTALQVREFSVRVTLCKCMTGLPRVPH